MAPAVPIFWAAWSGSGRVVMIYLLVMGLAVFPVQVKLEMTTLLACTGVIIFFIFTVSSCIFFSFFLLN